MIGINLVDENLHLRYKLCSLFSNFVCYLAVFNAWYFVYLNFADGDVYMSALPGAIILLFGQVKSSVVLLYRDNFMKVLDKMVTQDFVPERFRFGVLGAHKMADLYLLLQRMGKVVIIYNTFGLTVATILAIFTRVTASAEKWGESLIVPFGLFDVNRSPNFEIAFLFEFVSLPLSGFFNMASDLLITSVVASSVTHLKIIQLTLRNSDIHYDSDAVDEPYAYIVDIIKYHLGVINILKDVEKMCNAAIWFTFAGHVGSLSISLYTMSTLEKFSPSDVWFAFLVGLITVAELFLYCYFANEITEQNKEISRAACEFNWNDKSRDVKRALIILTLMAQRPLYLTAGKVSVVSLDLFVKILKVSYTYLTVLKKVKS